jgi:uncharacterized protein
MSALRTAFAILCLALPLGALGADFAPAQLQGFPRDQLRIETASKSVDLQIWLADTPEHQEQGLMFLTELPSGYGMLFPLATPRIMTMWMKNTYVPLDMLFVGSDGTILRIARDTKPLSTDIISSVVPVGAVLEIRAGESRRLGLREGASRVIHPSLGGAKRP